MSWHAALVILETAFIWSSTGLTLAYVVARHPIRRIEHLLRLYVLQADKIADQLDTKTSGGLTDLVEALESGPAGAAKKRPKK